MSTYYYFYAEVKSNGKWIGQSIVKGISERHNKKHQIT
mgnify:CR=1 FL=1